MEDMDDNLHSRLSPIQLLNETGMCGGNRSFAQDCFKLNESDDLGENKTGNHSSYFYYETEQLIFLWILLFVIVIGNSAVLASLVLAKTQTKSRMNFFIMHLALADLSVGLINVLTDIIWKLTISFMLGNIGCKLVKYFQTVVLYSSNYVLVALSIDRWDAITHPLRFSRSWKRARILVSSAWIISFFFATPALVLFHEENIEGITQCWIPYTQDIIFMRIYLTTAFTILYVVPAIIIAVCYTIMVRTIWTQSRILTPQGRFIGTSSGNSNGCTRTVNGRTGEALSSDVGPNIVTGGRIRGFFRKTFRSGLEKSGGAERRMEPLFTDDDSRRASSRGLIPKAKIKSVKMTFVIVFVFILCASPYVVFNLMDVYGAFKLTQTKVAMSTFFQSLSPLNSAANPLIYCLFSTHICRNLRKIRVINWLALKLCPNWGKSSPATGNRRPAAPFQDTSQRTSTHFSSLTDSLIRTTCTGKLSNPVKSSGSGKKVAEFPNKEVHFQANKLAEGNFPKTS